MRTTLNLNEVILKDAISATNIHQKTKLIHEGLMALIRESSRQRLSKLYGKIKTASSAPRKKSAS